MFASHVRYLRTHGLKRFPHQLAKGRHNIPAIVSSFASSSSPSSPLALASPSSRHSFVGNDSRRSFSGASKGPVQEYLAQLLERGEIQRDEHQFSTAKQLDRLYHNLMVNDPTPAAQASSSGVTSSLMGSISSLFSSSQPSPSTITPTVGPPPVMGTYLFGGVGCGKTFLMETFYESVDQGPWSQNKQLVHYHKFMLTVHEHMHRARKDSADDSSGDLLSPVIASIAQQGQLICLDEFQVTDIADAMILQQLFYGLWHTQGCILVATSNRAPTELYWNGLQRDRFLPFIADLQQNCTVVNMLASENDYRMLLKDGGIFLEEGNAGGADSKAASSNDIAGPQSPKSLQVYYCGKAEYDDWRKLYNKFTDNTAIAPTSLQTQGRQVRIPLASLSSGVCRFTFADLCQKALGAADYIVVGNHFHTVFVENIPTMTLNELNWLRRFITFIDSMYEAKVNIILQTRKAEQIDDLFQPPTEQTEGATVHDEVFAWNRTLSRLAEMSSSKYLQQQWKGGSGSASSLTKDDVVRSSLQLQPSLDDSIVDDSVPDVKL